MNMPGMPPLADMLQGFREGATEARKWAEMQLEHIGHLLEDIRAGIDNLDTSESMRLVRTSGAADGGGAVDVTFGRPRAGFEWKVERITTNVPGAGAVAATLFRGDIGPGDAVDKITDARDFVRDYGQPIFVPQAVPLRLQAAGATANANVVVTLQVVELKAKGADSGNN